MRKGVVWMTDITNLTNKILQDAQERKEKIIVEAEADASMYLRQQQLTADNTFAKNIDQYEKELRNKLQTRVSQQHILMRNKTLQIKQKIVESVYAQAIQELNTMNQHQFFVYMNKKIAESSFVGEIVVKIGEQSKALLTEEDIKTIKSEHFPEKELVFTDEYLKNQAGFILVQDNVELNYTFEGLLQILKQEVNHELVSTLFSESNL